MSDPAFDPMEALGKMKVQADSPEPPVAAGGVIAPEEPPAAPSHAEAQVSRRDQALAMVAKYRAAHPGDARTDEQLLVCPYGGYEMLQKPEQYHAVVMERLARMRPQPRPEESPK